MVKGFYYKIDISRRLEAKAEAVVANSPNREGYLAGLQEAKQIVEESKAACNAMDTLRAALPGPILDNRASGRRDGLLCAMSMLRRYAE